MTRAKAKLRIHFTLRLRARRHSPRRSPDSRLYRDQEGFIAVATTRCEFYTSRIDELQGSRTNTGHPVLRGRLMLYGAEAACTGSCCGLSRFLAIFLPLNQPAGRR